MENLEILENEIKSRINITCKNFNISLDYNLAIFNNKIFIDINYYKFYYSDIIVLNSVLEPLNLSLEIIYSNDNHIRLCYEFNIFNKYI